MFELERLGDSEGIKFGLGGSGGLGLGGSGVLTSGLGSGARRYVGVIRQGQPHEPYRLDGWSFGGVLAFEIARQLGAFVLHPL
ncbi:MAG: Polyketide synthase -like protein [Sphaerisporangium sp.]|nr:Polyketide synthase -like protein [Sphaerisporangium sp.]